jgi:serine/threonine protein kinase
MSPEQARGKPVDRRTDIWAFGCILFEMLSGADAFEVGETVFDAIAAVLTREPDWTALPADVPAHIRLLIRRCLQKDPQKRLRDIGDARIQIDEGAIEGELIAPAAAPPQPLWKRAMPATIAALTAGAVVGAGMWRLTPPPASPRVTRLSFTLGDGQQLSRPAHQFLAISPDGTQIVYVANGRLYLRAMSALEATPIPGTDSAPENPAFSSDGRSIVFGSRADNALKRIAVTGGAAVTICQAGAVLGLSWAPDGSIFFGQERTAKN